MIRFYHSYCKQPKYAEKLQWSAITNQERTKLEKQKNTSIEGVNEFYELSRLVNDRLSKLLERRSAESGGGSKFENDFDESLVTGEPSKTTNKSFKNKSRDVELDDIDIDPGYEISLDDIKKLPDFSYEE